MVKICINCRSKAILERRPFGRRKYNIWSRFKIITHKCISFIKFTIYHVPQYCPLPKLLNDSILLNKGASRAKNSGERIRVIMALLFLFFQFLCSQRNFGRHIVIALSVRPSVRPSRFRVRSISPIFFEVGIPNLVCGYILGWRSVAYFFRVTVTLTLTSDLVFRIIVSGAYLLYYLN